MDGSTIFFDPPSDAAGRAPLPGQRRRTVLVTGAAGNVGRDFARRAASRYALRLMVIPGQDPRELADHGEVVEGDLTRPETLAPAVEGADAVLHLGADSRPHAKWESVLANNLDGLQNLLHASAEAGVRRVVFASSVHAVFGYAPRRGIRPEDAPAPTSLYGASKAFGEALGKYYALKHDLSVVCVRIGWRCEPERLTAEPHPGLRQIWISPRDLQQLLCLCLDDTRLRYAVVHGTSKNPQPLLDIESTRRLLGYEPQDDAGDPAYAGDAKA
ncbi:MAG: NAD(P)-dependent oxidoreductase [Planctomycetota bacterium]